MSTFTDNENQIKQELNKLQSQKLELNKVLSMGISVDYVFVVVQCYELEVLFLENVIIATKTF